ncbi:MAG: DUF6600 domain-containing protein [Bacteroidota bacterium]|jgi:hypothetical protein
MKRLLLFLSIFITANLLTPKSSATSNPVISDIGIQFGFFYSSLVPHGEWIKVESGTRVWRPFHIPHHWRPYLVGRWVWTDDYGWYWMSNEPFGWITYHYGRWYYDDYYGWVWTPDDVWAPAWVEWRYDDDYIGWAPLPPYATFHMTFGIRFTTHWSAPAHYWNIVHYNRFGSVIRFRDTAPEEYARRFIHTGRSGPQYGMDRERIINRGVDRAVIERRGNVRFARTEVREIRGQSGERITQSNDNQRIEIYRPTRDEMLRSTERIETQRGERNLSIDMNKVAQPRIESRTPQIQQQSQRDRNEMRRELIQRHERRQNPSPPSEYKGQQKRIEQRRESSRITQPNKPAREKRSENKSERRRGK